MVLGIGLLVLIALAALVIIFIISYFNRFAVLGNRIDNSLSQIDVQLKRRADLIPNLVETVKGYAKHEKAAIKEVTDARKALVTYRRPFTLVSIILSQSSIFPVST